MKSFFHLSILWNWINSIWSVSKYYFFSCWHTLNISTLPLPGFPSLEWNDTYFRHFMKIWIFFKWNWALGVPGVSEGCSFKSIPCHRRRTASCSTEANETDIGSPSTLHPWSSDTATSNPLHTFECSSTDDFYTYNNWNYFLMKIGLRGFEIVFYIFHHHHFFSFFPFFPSDFPFYLKIYIKSNINSEWNLTQICIWICNLGGRGEGKVWFVFRLVVATHHGFRGSSVFISIEFPPHNFTISLLPP